MFVGCPPTPFRRHKNYFTEPPKKRAENYRLIRSRKGVAAGSGGGLDGDEVAGPAGEVLSGRADLAGDGSAQRAARGSGHGELDPFRVDVDSMATRAPLRASATARSSGVVDMLAAYMRSPKASWPRALRATNSAWPMVPPDRHHLAASAVGWPLFTRSHRFCRTLYTASPGAGTVTPHVPIRACPEGSMTRVARPCRSGRTRGPPARSRLRGSA